ncbi:hypothetical protein CYMTET_41353 [Cymbomonas tetramitiformis]|uniref:4a-hydroxytetrahydrobiopterin dehydratase n=1 Tax=Cymbomonas tetramitiformis TaxID=36881 RepID=A0AAE0C7C2_9CHLO|nr:hypothetical protein CYMTET_41353 [Cymbomonas tetramitiformis]
MFKSSRSVPSRHAPRNDRYGTVAQLKHHKQSVPAFSKSASSPIRFSTISSQYTHKSGRVQLHVFGSSFASQKCEPCEQEKQPEACAFMGFNGVMRSDDAQRLLDSDEELAGWELKTSKEGVLTLHRTVRTRSFKHGLELFSLIGCIAEEEGHHPDLHLEGWNKAISCLRNNERKVAIFLPAYGVHMLDKTVARFSNS